MKILFFVFTLAMSFNAAIAGEKVCQSLNGSIKVVLKDLSLESIMLQDEEVGLVNVESSYTYSWRSIPSKCTFNYRAEDELGRRYSLELVTAASSSRNIGDGDYCYDNIYEAAISIKSANKPSKQIRRVLKCR